MPSRVAYAGYIADEVNEDKLANPAFGFPCTVLMFGHVAGPNCVNPAVHAYVELRHASTVDGDYQLAQGTQLEPVMLDRFAQLILGPGSSATIAISFDPLQLLEFLNPRSYADLNPEGGFAVWVVW